MSNEQPKRAPHLLARDFKQNASSMRNVSFALVPVGTTQKAVLDPAFWSSVAGYLQPRSRIEIEPEDGAWLLEVRVSSAGPNWARVEVVREKTFVSAESIVAKAKGFEIKWGNPQTKHRVWRLSDKTVVKDGFDTPEQAAEWLAANQEAMTA